MVTDARNSRNIILNIQALIIVVNVNSNTFNL